MQHARFIGAAAAIAVFATLGLSSLFAQSRGQTPPQKQETKGKEVTLVGKIVDLQCYMTGEYPTKDQAECARKCIRAGVPAALETDNGLVIVGMGQRGPGREIEKHAMATVELKGKLYEKHGVKYIDIASVKPAKPGPEEEGDWEEPEEEEPDQP
ncbi:MAG TPA: hypothetical protein VM487_11835 [Phycisphaerae bacterium]|nr:hypothetical protein [Phycisphaerae bacterium]